MTLRILTVTTLFPNAAQPHHGVFVRNRLAALVAREEIVAKVVAPVGWVPPLLAGWMGMDALRAVPTREVWRGVEILHPRYLVIPKIGMSVAPALLFATLLRTARQLIKAGETFDLIDAHYFYPDGVAAVWLGAALGLPVVVTGRGSDLTLLPNFAQPRRLIRSAAHRADGLVTVCADLRERLVDLGVARDRVTVLPNGVDLDMYRPSDRAQARKNLGLPPAGELIGSVGHLIPRKGHDLVIEALSGLPGVDLAIVGDGPERERLVAQAARRGLAGRVHFLGARRPQELAAIYPAFDALVLASSREGWANVLLEAMACDIPVVATSVGGTPEVVTAPEAGLLVQDRTAAALREAIRRLLDHPPAPGQTRRYAEGHSWENTIKGLRALFDSIRRNTGAA